MKQWLRTSTVSLFLLFHLTESITEINPEFRKAFSSVEIWDGFTAAREESWTVVAFVHLLPFCSWLKLDFFVGLQKKSNSPCPYLKTVLLLQEQGPGYRLFFCHLAKQLWLWKEEIWGCQCCCHLWGHLSHSYSSHLSFSVTLVLTNRFFVWNSRVIAQICPPVSKISFSCDTSGISATVGPGFGISA